MQLPAGVARFAGRAAELARLDEILEPSVVMSVAGVGKTALAVYLGALVSGPLPRRPAVCESAGFRTGRFNLGE
jgi:hypothetical protein